MLHPCELLCVCSGTQISIPMLLCVGLCLYTVCTMLDEKTKHPPSGDVRGPEPMLTGTEQPLHRIRVHGNLLVVVINDRS